MTPHQRVGWQSPRTEADLTGPDFERPVSDVSIKSIATRSAASTRRGCWATCRSCMTKDVIMHEERAGEPQELTLVPVEVVPDSHALDLRRKDLPATIKEAGYASGFAYEEFLFG